MDFLSRPLILKHMIHIDYCNYSISSSKWSVSFTWVQLCHQYVSCKFEPRSWRGVLDTTLCDKVCQWLATGQWFSPSTPGFSTNKIYLNDIAEIVLKVALNIITPSYCVLKLLLFFVLVVLVTIQNLNFSIPYISSSMIVDERW